MNASINVTSGFAFEKSYDFEEEEFQEISEYIHEYFKGLTHYSIYLITWNILPRWVTGFYKQLKVVLFIVVKQDHLCQLLSKPGKDLQKRLVPRTLVQNASETLSWCHYSFPRIRLQDDQGAKKNPRSCESEKLSGRVICSLEKILFEIIETILIDAERDSNWGYFHLVATITGVFLGASDTLAYDFLIKGNVTLFRNTMTWLSLVLADHPEVQEKMFEEIKAAREIDPDLKKENCPFTRSVLLESRRLNSVTDTFHHVVSEDIDVKGFHIPKNSQIFGESKHFLF
jgi:hypothetical protein